MTAVPDVGEVSPPDFSVLCSAYRCEEFLADTIESVIEQTHSSWELIVVDNGNSDSVAEIVRRYTDDPRVRLIRQENRRLIGGISTAAAAATGRYLFPLDSDDQLMPEFCRRMAEVLATRPEIDVLSCDAYLFRDGEELDLARRFLRYRTGLDHRLTVADLVGKHDVIPYFAVVRRAAWFAVGGYRPGTDLIEDIALFLQLATSGYDIRVLPEPLTRYRMREDSSSRDPSTVESFELGRERAYIEAGTATGDPVTLRALDRRLRSLRYEQALRRARWAFIDGDWATARSAAREAHRQQPTARSTAVMAGTRLAPGVLRLIHPTKRRLTLEASRLAARVAAVARSRPR